MALMTADEQFAAFVEAKRAREAAAPAKVTWRRVSADTGGGLSGLGPQGRLVYVRRDGRAFAYGRVADNGVRELVGRRTTLDAAKRAAETLFTTDPAGLAPSRNREPYRIGRERPDRHTQGGRVMARKTNSNGTTVVVETPAEAPLVEAEGEVGVSPVVATPKRTRKSAAAKPEATPEPKPEQVSAEELTKQLAQALKQHGVELRPSPKGGYTSLVAPGGTIGYLTQKRSGIRVDVVHTAQDAADVEVLAAALTAAAARKGKAS